MDELIFGQKTWREPSQVVPAVVEDVNENGVRLRFDGQEAGRKRYRQIQTALRLSAGDRVLAARIAGTYVVIGKIGADNGATVGLSSALDTRLSEILREVQQAVEDADEARYAAEEARIAAEQAAGFGEEEEDEKDPEIKYYDYKNAASILIADGTEANVIVFDKYITYADTRVQFDGNVCGEVKTTESYDTATDTYTEHDGNIKITYLMDGVPAADMTPETVLFDGAKLIPLRYVWHASAGLTRSMAVRFRCEGCTLFIPAGESTGTLSGPGLAGDNAWDGTVHIYEAMEKIDFGCILGGMMDNAAITIHRPGTGSISQNVSKFNIWTVIHKNIEDSLGRELQHIYAALYDIDVTKENITKEGNVWKNSDQSIDGTVTTANDYVGRILKIRSVHTSGNGDVTYIVSFDGGESWWYWADDWTLYDGGYSMVESTMAAITDKQWKRMLKDSGTIMIRAILEKNASLSDIRILISDAKDWSSSSHLQVSCQPYYAIKSRDRTDLRYEYLYQSEETDIDVGRMSKVDIDTTIYSEVDEIYAHARKTGV